MKYKLFRSTGDLDKSVLKHELVAVENGSSIDEVTDALIRAVRDDLAEMPEYAHCETAAYAPEPVKSFRRVRRYRYEMLGIRVHIFINYFDEWMPEGAKQLVEYDAIMKDERLASLLGMQDSFKPEDEPDLERIDALLERFETETDLNRNDVFYGVFQLIMKSKDEDITLGKIADLMEVLLYLVLNGGLKQDE